MAEAVSRIILLNGTSSAGKSTLARALRPHLEPQFCFFSSDQLADAGFRPTEKQVRYEQRELFFHGFHAAIAAFASVGLDLLVEHIVEQKSWGDELHRLLAPFDVFWVGVHAPLAEIERREQSRGDRQIGEGAFHLKTHAFCHYECEVDTTEPIEGNVAKIVSAWRARKQPSSVVVR